MGDQQTGVAEQVGPLLGVEHREGDVGREGLLDRNADLPLARSQALGAEPVAALRQQGMMFNLIPLQGQQGFTDLFGEGDERLSGLPGGIAEPIETNLDGPWGCLHAIAGDPVIGRSQQVAGFIAQRQGVGARIGQRQIQTAGSGGDSPALTAAILQAQQLIAGRYRVDGRCRALGLPFEGDGFSRGTELLVGLQSIGGQAALDQDLAGTLDAPGGGIVGQQGDDVAAGLLGGGQL